MSSVFEEIQKSKMEESRMIAEKAEAVDQAVAEEAVKGYHAVENGVVGGYKAIENGVVSGYKAVEGAVVGTYSRIEDAFVRRFLTREGETVEEAKREYPADGKALKLILSLTWGTL